MIELPVTLTSTGGAVSFASPVPLGYTKNKGVYRLLVTAEGEWEGLTIRCFWHLPGGADPASSLVQDGAVDVPASVTAHPGNGCITFEGSDGVKTVTSADLRYRVGSNSGTEDGTMPEPGTPAWEQLVSETKANADAAERAKNDAQAAAEGVKTAAAKADEAAQKADGAAQRAEAAQKATEQAEAAATESIAGAKNEALSAISTGEQGALGAVQQAQTTATESVQAAQTAAESAVSAAKTNAVQEVEAAAKPAQAAATKAEEAAERSEQASIAASNAADDAKRSAGIATGAAGDSALNAENAQKSALSAQQSAENAAEIQSAAAAIADAAAKSAQEALESKTAAATSEGNAAESAKKAQDVADSLPEDYTTAVNEIATLKQQVANITPDDSTVGEKPWTSKKIVDSLCMPFEESGNPVQCYPVENYPLGVKVSWEPTQDGSGYPSPDNIRPISGRDAVQVTHCGKNLLKPPGINKNYNGIVFTANDDGTVTINGTSTSTAYYDYFYENNSLQLAEGDYVLIPGSSLTRISVKNNITGTFYASQIGENRICHIPAGKYIVFIDVNTGITADNVIVRPQIVLGSTATPYEPYTGDTYDIALPETVYGGEMDAVSGEGIKNWKRIVFDGTENWKTRPVNYISYSLPLPMCSKTGFCTHFKKIFYDSIRPGTGTGETGCYLEFSQVAIFNVPFENVADWKNYLAAQYSAGTPVYIVFQYSNEVNDHFTATGAQPIPALSGVNTIYTDADGVVVTGAEDPKHTITELKNAIISLGSNI